MQIYIYRQDQQLGPYSADEIREKLDSSVISPLDYVWWPGQADWVPLGKSTIRPMRPPRVPGTMPTLPNPDDVRLPITEEAPVQATSNLAVASLTCACLGLVLGFFTSIPAVILGHLALLDLKKRPERVGRSYAMSGLIIGYIMTVLTLTLTGIYVYEMPALVAAEEARTKSEVTIDLNQPLLNPHAKTVSKLEPTPDDTILFQPPPVDYSSVTNAPPSKPGPDAKGARTQAPDTGTPPATTPAAPAPNP